MSVSHKQTADWWFWFSHLVVSTQGGEWGEEPEVEQWAGQGFGGRDIHAAFHPEVQDWGLQAGRAGFRSWLPCSHTVTSPQESPFPYL